MRTLTFRHHSWLVTTSLLVAIIWALSSPAPAARPTYGAEQQKTDAGQDFIFLGESRPILLRMHVRLDGKPLQAVWENFMKTLFDYVDVNGDGVLSAEEAARVPHISRILNGGIVQDSPKMGKNAGGPTLAELDADRDGKVSRAEFSAYYRRAGFAPFQFQTDAQANGAMGLGVFTYYGNGPAEPTAKQIADSIFALLDTNKDGKLSKEELAAAREVLLEMDENSDEILTKREIAPNDAPLPRPDFNPAAMLGGGAPAAKQIELFMPIMNPGEVPSDFARRLQDRYGPKLKKGEQKNLSRKELGLDEATFALLDVNGDGVLDALELANFAKRTPDLELAVEVGVKGSVQLWASKEPVVGKVTVKDGIAQATFGTTRLNVRSAEDGRSAGGIMEAMQNKQDPLGQFKKADKNGDGHLDVAEAKAHLLFNDAFAMIDRDGDGKLSEKEVVAYFNQMDKLKQLAQKAAVTLVISEKSAGLFDLLDTNHDGRLTVRELRGAVPLLAKLGHQERGYLTKEDLPASYDLHVRSGPVSMERNSSGLAAPNSAGQKPAATPAATAGPLWFRKMDRNGDGDVSRSEFLGTDEQFQEIDTDGDGLISREEAERYDAAIRRKE